MSALVRRVDESDPSEEVMLLGGAAGLVSLHLPGGCPQALVVHSPVEIPGMTGPQKCTCLEMACWCLSSISSAGLAELLTFCQQDAGSEESIWHAMKVAYDMFLAGARR